MYQCCIFDLDGTLVNSVYAIQKAVNGTLEHFGLGTVSAEETRLFAGDGYKKLVERAMEARGNRDEGGLRRPWPSIRRSLRTAACTGGAL